MKKCLAFLIFINPTFAAQIVSENQTLTCQEFRLHEEIRVYKDPSLFLPQLSQIYADPATGWKELMKESPLVTTLKGTVQLMKLGSETEFKNFGVISKIYELVDARFSSENSSLKEKNPRIIPVKICSQDSYNDLLGFVLSADLYRAQFEARERGSLPPSAHPNPIPKLRKSQPSSSF